MPFSLRHFQLHEMLRCGLDLRRMVGQSSSIEAAAQAVVRYLYAACVDSETGERQLVLVRFYKTHPFANLPQDLQSFAAGLLRGKRPREDMQTLVLLASAGDQPEWNDRRDSRGHQAIPLASVEMVERAPMISGLVRGLGLEVSEVVTPRYASITSIEGKTYNVFFVPEAKGSSFIPAQEDFVVPYDISSVLGFGGLLLNGDLYSVILFSRVPVAQSSADRFRNVSLDLKVALLSLRDVPTFAGMPVPAGTDNEKA